MVLRMTSAYGFPYDPRMAALPKKNIAFLRMASTYGLLRMVKPHLKLALRMALAHGSPRMNTRMTPNMTHV